MGPPHVGPPPAVPLVAIFGPTGTGKTALAADLADLVPCRLISCDAVQVYRGLDAATAKPRGREARHPWALVDVAEPARDFNLGDWVRAAEAEVADAWSRGLVPVVAGGTGMYLRGLLKGVAEAPPRDAALRARLAARADERGVPYLHRLLRRLDPEGAARLAPGDRQRLVRALEVRLRAGASLSALQGGGWQGPDRYRVLRVGLTLPREELSPRLDARVETFFRDGLVDEVRRLLGPGGVPPAANAFRAIGYREVVGVLAAGAAPDERALVADVQRATRQYAKRQRTWFRSEEGTAWHDPREPELAARLAAEVRDWVGAPGA